MSSTNYDSIKNNSGFYVLTKNDKNYNFYGDISNIPKLNKCFEILEFISKCLNIQISNIEYYYNKKNENDKICYSMHFTIPSISGTLKQQKQIFNTIKKRNILICQYLDIEVYEPNRYIKM